MRTLEAESDNNRFIAALDFLLALVAFLDEHSRRRIMLARFRALRCLPKRQRQKNRKQSN